MIIPEFLIEMSEQMNNEDVRCTAEPIWTVCYDEWLTCADDRGDKTVLLLSDNGDNYIECSDSDHTGIFDYLKEHYPVWCMTLIHEFDEEEGNIDELSSYLELDDYVDLPDNLTIEKLEMQRYRKIVKSCLTEEDARHFIKRKQHDYAPLYTYVESMIFCPQMIELRAWIKSIKNNACTTNINVIR